MTATMSVMLNGLFLYDLVLPHQKVGVSLPTPESELAYDLLKQSSRGDSE